MPVTRPRTYNRVISSTKLVDGAMRGECRVKSMESGSQSLIFVLGTGIRCEEYRLIKICVQVM